MGVSQGCIYESRLGMEQQWYVLYVLIPSILVYELVLTLLATEDINPGFERLCIVEADLNNMKDSVTLKQYMDELYGNMTLTIAIQLGGTELCARIEWDENVRFMGTLCSEIDGTDVWLLSWGYDTKWANISYTGANRAPSWWEEYELDTGISRNDHTNLNDIWCGQM